jgi:hypothetical protein
VATERPRSRRGQRGLFGGLAVVAGAGALVNLASPSLPERLIWVPVTLTLALAAGRAARALAPAAVTA